MILGMNQIEVCFFFFNWDIIAYNIVFVSAVHSVNKL